MRAGVDALAAELAADGRTHESGTPLLHVAYPTQANVVFPTLPRSSPTPYAPSTRSTTDQSGPHPDLVESRWMCSWDTTDDDVDAFLATLRKAFG